MLPSGRDCLLPRPSQHQVQLACEAIAFLSPSSSSSLGMQMSSERLRGDMRQEHMWVSSELDAVLFWDLLPPFP